MLLHPITLCFFDLHTIGHAFPFVFEGFFIESYPFTPFSSFYLTESTKQNLNTKIIFLAENSASSSLKIFNKKRMKKDSENTRFGISL